MDSQWIPVHFKVDLAKDMVLGFIIAIPFIIVMFIVQMRQFNRNMPDEARKKEFLVTLQEMKQRGCSYAERFEFLSEAGLRRDVANVLLGEAERISSLGKIPIRNSVR